MAQLQQLLDTLQTMALHVINGFLALFWVAWDHGSLLITFGMCVVLYLAAPPDRHSQPWLLGTSILAAVAAGVAMPPVPVLMACMSMCGAVAVKLDRFNPDALRWRVSGGLALYALASLGYLAYHQYLGMLDADAWARQIGGQAEAGYTLQQGRAFLDTLATWGLWLIIPLGFLSLLAQGLLVHPPLAAPHQTLTQIRSRE